MSLTPELLQHASEPYRAAGRFAYHFARSKLAHDPMFDAILSRGLLARRTRILDLGCGQGLLAACLLAAAGQAGGSSPPAIHGIDLTGRYVARARIAWGEHAQFTAGDVRRADFGTADGIVLLDVLHYFEYAEQLAVLERAHRSLSSGGVLLLRVSNAAAGMGFRMGTWVDRMALVCGGRALQRLHCRALPEWRALLAAIGFDTETLPMSAGTPFANALIVATPR